MKLAWAALLFALPLTSCQTRDAQHWIVVSVPERRMVVFEHGRPLAMYPVSTSKYSTGDGPGLRGTPLGELEVAEKIGAGAPSGAVFRDRRWTNEIVAPDTPGRDPIVTRILWLRGREAQNANAYARYIYIHGTTEEREIGRPTSYGCILMRSRDIIRLYHMVGLGTRVTIVDTPLAAVAPKLAEKKKEQEPRRNL